MKQKRSWMGISFYAIVFSLLCLILGACQKKEEAPPPPPPPEVDVLTIRTQPVSLSVELPGRTAPLRIAEVRPQVGGIIQKRLFEEGTEVQAGELLYQIDPATYQARVDSAKATLSKAEAAEHSARLKAERYRNLVRTKAVSAQDQVEMEASWKQAAAEVAYARAALDTARINLNYTRVTAPISGRIGRSMVTEGALVTAEQASALAVIQQLNPLYVDVNQASNALVELKREISSSQPNSAKELKSEVTVLLENGVEYNETGILEFSEVSVNQSTGTVLLRAIVANPNMELLPGMFVRARIIKGVQPNAILIPAASVIRNNRGQAIVKLVNKDSVVEAKVIKTGQALGENILVTDGLQVGERIIVNGLQKANAGDLVRTVETEKKAEPGKQPDPSSKTDNNPQAQPDQQPPVAEPAQTPTTASPSAE